MRTTLLCALAAFTLCAPCRAELFEAPKPPLIYSDLQQPMVRLQRLWGLRGQTGKGNYYDAALAAPIPLYSNLAGSSGWFLNGVAGAGARFGANAPGRLYASDYTGGLSLVRRSYSGDFELFLYRKASHLGDSVIYGAYGYPRRDAERDVLRLLYFTDGESAFPGAAGGFYILDKEPASPSGRLGVQYSFELPLSRTLFAGATFVMSQEYAWALDSNLQLGARLGPDRNDARRPALVLEYHSGATPYGQFFAGRERTLSLGIAGAL